MISQINSVWIDIFLKKYLFLLKTKSQMGWIGKKNNEQWLKFETTNKTTNYSLYTQDIQPNQFAILNMDLFLNYE